MKPYLLSAFFLLSYLFLLAQNPSINFSKDSYQNVIKQAQAQNKPIFIDFYTDWCGPCKYMEKEVFVDPEVGAFMNEHFISLRVDAEKEELDLVAKHQVQAYPTLAFLNKAGALVFKQEGAVDSETFLGQAQDLINQGVYSETYAKRSKSFEAVYNYARSLKMTKPAKANKVALEYLKQEGEKNWKNEENWQIIREFVLGTNLISFKKILANPEIREQYSEQLKDFAFRGFKDLAGRSLGSRNSYSLNQGIRLVRRYPKYFPNPDSLVLANQLNYAERHAPEDLPTLLEEYIDTYTENQQHVLLFAANLLVQNHFNRDILGTAIMWAKQSLRIEESALANMTLGLAYEKLNEFQSASAYTVLALQESDEAMLPLIEEHLKRINHKLVLGVQGDGVTAARKTELSDDGRFTLGAGSKRLMYGYPVPTSTSHFVVKIKGKLATNSPTLAAKGPKHLTGQLNYEGTAMTPAIRIAFEFQNVKIIQELQPVDKSFQPISEGYAQYYRVSYRFENLDHAPKRVGLGILFDTMIDDNDHCVIAADGRVLESEYGFAGRTMPRELLFYRTEGDTSDTMGAAIIRGNGATMPDKMVVGRWPVLHETTWQLKPAKVKYGDSAYFLQWENWNLTTKGVREFVTYYGLPSHKEPELRLIVEDRNLLTMNENIYFITGKDNVDLNAKMKISEILDNKGITIAGVLLNGYADVTGNENSNFDLSKRRIENVGKIFRGYGIPFVPKPYGVEQSEKNDLNSTYGNVWDRRVEIVVYYKIKEADPLAN